MWIWWFGGSVGMEGGETLAGIGGFNDVMVGARSMRRSAELC